VRSRTSRPHDVRTSRDRVARMLASQRKRGRIPALPKFRSGGALVDVPIAMPCTTPWKVASARRRHECALRRQCGLAISYCLPRLARARTGATGCLVPVGRSSLRMTSHAQPYDVPHVGRRGISLQRFSPRRASQFLSRPNGSPTSPKRSLEPQARGTVSAVSTVLPRHLGMVVGATRDSGIASRAGFE
jgi:hypothetical protein